MCRYIIVSVEEMINRLGEERCNEVLSQFSCPLNKDVETFLRNKNKAIEFAKQRIAMTFIVLYNYQNEHIPAGFFTIANKIITVSQNALNSSLRQRIKKFAIYDNNDEKYKLSCPLIAQLAKNYSKGYNSLMTGSELLALACDKVREAQSIIGGKTVYLECDDNAKLIKFYENNGFIKFSERVSTEFADFIKNEKLLMRLIKYIS